LESKRKKNNPLSFVRSATLSCVAVPAFGREEKGWLLRKRKAGIKKIGIEPKEILHP
jgi:hypothetical protein